jgi:hypothetical protein
MHGHETRAAILELAHRRADRRRDIEEFEVTENLLVPLQHPVKQLEIATAHHEFEADLVERDRITEFVGQRLRPVAIGHVHGEYQAVPGRDVFCAHCESRLEFRPRILSV